MNSILTRLRRSPERLLRAVAAHYRAEQTWRRRRHEMAAQQRIITVEVSVANCLRRMGTEAAQTNNWGKAAGYYGRSAAIYDDACAPEWAAEARVLERAALNMLGQVVRQQRPVLVAVEGERVG